MTEVEQHLQLCKYEPSIISSNHSLD